MNRPAFFRRLLAAVLLAALPLSTVTAATPTPKVTALSASAQAKRLTTLKTKGAAEITRRLATLTATLDVVTAAKLAGSDKAALTKQIQDEQAGLAGLQAKLAADATLADARTDITSITSDYRVYALIVPKARLVAATSQLVAIQEQLTALQAKLQTKVDATADTGVDMTAARTSLDALSAKLAAAKASTDGLSAKLLALQPTDYNSDHAVLVSYRTALASTRASLKDARSDAASIIAVLKQAEK